MNNIKKEILTTVLDSKVLAQKWSDDVEELWNIIVTGDAYGDERDVLREAGFIILEVEGGGEGGTEWCHTVFEWKGTPYMINYNYYSYDGYNIDEDADIFEVRSVEKTITVYTRK